MAGKKDKDKRFAVVSALLWQDFGTGAGMPMTSGCVQAAMDRGYYNNVRGIIGKLGDGTKLLKETRACAKQGGKRAAKEAKAKDHKSITKADFNRAAAHIEALVLRIRRKGAKSKKDKIQPMGGIC